LAKSIGGLYALIARADANAATLAGWVEKTPACDFLAKTPATRSNTSVTLVEKEGAGFDFNAYRDSPPGLRIWCRATVEAADIAVLTQWIDWAYAEATAGLVAAD